MAKTTQLAAAALPLTGAELIALVQDGVSCKVSAQALAALGGDKGDPGGDASQVGTRLQAETMNFAAGIDMIRTTGFATRGDGGGALYVRWQAPMAALLAEQEGYSWFEAGDGSRWEIEAGQMHFAAMFGAVGDNVDRTTELKRAIEAPMVRVLWLGNLTHRISQPIIDTNGKVILGNWDRKSSVLSYIPFAVGTEGAENGQASACISVKGTAAKKVVGGGVFGVVCEVNRAGLGTGVGDSPSGTPWESLNRVSGIRRQGYVRGHHIKFCLIRNATGYPIYTATSGAERAYDNVTADCLVINCQTGYEATGEDIEETYINCLADSRVDDGGAQVVLDSQFHFYNGTKRITMINCGAIGPAPALVVAVTNGLPNVGITISGGLFMSSAGGPCAFIEGAAGIRNKVTMDNATFISTTGLAMSVGNSDVECSNSSFTGEVVGTVATIGGVITFANGSKSISRVDNVANTTQASSAILVEGAGAKIIRRGPLTLEAYHSFGGARNTNEFMLTEPDDLVLVPPVVGGPANLPPPLRRQQLHQVRVQGATLENHVYQDSATQYRASILLPLEPLDWDKVQARYEMRPPFGNTDFSGTITIVGNGRLAVSPNEVYVRISTTAALPVGYKLHIELWENV